METKKYWIRFTLLTLLPILVGLIVGLLIVNFGHQNCVEKSQLEQSNIELNQVKEVLETFENDKLLAEVLEQSQQSADREIKKLESILNPKHEYWTITTVDSIVEAAMLKVRGYFPIVKSESPVFEVRQSLIDFHRNKAIALGWNTKLWLRGEIGKEKENQYIQSLILQGEKDKEELENIKESLREKEKKIENLEAQLKAKGCPPCPTHICDHSSCELGIEAAVYVDKINQIEIFLADLDNIYGKTNWAGDQKLRKWLVDRKAEYEELQIELKEQVNEINKNKPS